MIALETLQEVGRAPASPPPVLVTSLRDVRARRRRVAVGNFDGVHPGHAAVIKTCDTVLTFAPHPLAVLAPARAPAMLTDLAAKAELAGALGVSELVVIPFHRGMAQLSPESFVQDVLVGALTADHVSVGVNFRYGARAAGDAGALAADRRFTTSVAPLEEAEGEVVSSSRVRAAIARGEIALATRLLGRPHRLPCRVESVQRPGMPHRGRVAARLSVSAGHACPPSGWYVSRLRRPDPRRPSAECEIHIGPEGSDGRRDGLLVAQERWLASSRHVVVEVLRGAVQTIPAELHGLCA